MSRLAVTLLTLVFLSGVGLLWWARHDAPDPSKLTPDAAAVFFPCVEVSLPGPAVKAAVTPAGQRRVDR